MNWDTIQNISSQVVFLMLLIAVICYWVSLCLFSFKSKIAIQPNSKNILFKIGKLSVMISNLLLGFILLSRWIVSGYFPLSNLYESLLFLTWILLTIYLYIESEIKSELIGAIIMPITLLLNGFSNLTLSPEMQKASPLVPALQSNWLMLHVSMMLLSYGTLITGSLICILYLTVSYYQKIDFEQAKSIPLNNYEKSSLSCPILLAEPLEINENTDLNNIYSTTFFESIEIYNTHKMINEIIEKDELKTKHIAKWGINLVFESPFWVIAEEIFEPYYKFTKINKSVMLEIFDKWSYKLTFSAEKYENLCKEEKMQIEKYWKVFTDVSKSTKLDKLLFLQNLDNLSYRILGLGFPFLTIGIISGGVWANEAWGSYWSWDPKETWALITWIVFATYLHARLTKGWKGQKTAILGGLGFFVIWICYLGVNFLGKGLHSYGWFS